MKVRAEKPELRVPRREPGLGSAWKDSPYLSHGSCGFLEGERPIPGAAGQGGPKRTKTNAPCPQLLVAGHLWGELGWTVSWGGGDDLQTLLVVLGDIST